MIGTLIYWMLLEYICLSLTLYTFSISKCKLFCKYMIDLEPPNHEKNVNY